MQNPNAAEEATTSQKEQDETIDASYDVTAPVNREGNMRRANIGEKGGGGGFAPTSEWVCLYLAIYYKVCKRKKTWFVNSQRCTLLRVDDS